ncbi:Lsr2 family protein [Streptomyces goshikiensis]|uniref:histone-like nucleoid-structuring protein Lsr2 n=1 Tax=Streptomyces goshikiensis TaxID=1942 RepID=UPI003662FF5F
MAQKVQVLLVDDVDGGAADETVAFALDGKTYEIDLSAENAAKLRGIFTPYQGAGRKVSGKTGARSAPKRTQVPADAATMRAWAKSNGWPDLKNRGRVPADARAAYEKAAGAR